MIKAQTLAYHERAKCMSCGEFCLCAIYKGLLGSVTALCANCDGGESDIKAATDG